MELELANNVAAKAATRPAILRPEQNTPEAKNQLASEVLALIAPYTKDKTRRPPFSAADLVVIALLISPEPMTKVQILAWICENFSYYSSKSIEQDAESFAVPSYEHGRAMPPEDIIGGFADTFRHWDVPLYVHHDHSSAWRPLPPVTWDYDSGSDAENSLLFTPVRPGRVFLRDWLEPTRAGVFPFFELPAEVRVAIYELLFTFPANGILTRRHNFERLVASGILTRRINRGLVVLEREFDHTSPSAYWDTMPGQHNSEREVFGKLVLPRPNILFAMFSVCKQMYDEAMPVFYQGNFFFCGDLKQTISLSRLVPASMVHLRDIRITFRTVRDPAFLQEFLDGMQRFASSVTELRKLQVDFTASFDWLELDNSKRRTYGNELFRLRFGSHGEIPGFSDLAILASKADELVLSSGWPIEAEEWLYAEVERLTTEGHLRSDAHNNQKCVENG